MHVAMVIDRHRLLREHVMLRRLAIGLIDVGVHADVADRREGADIYAREVLFNLEQRVADVLGQVRKGLDVLDPDAIIAR